jgi:hypothetical protein
MSNSSGYHHPDGYTTTSGQDQDQRLPGASNHHQWSNSFYPPITSSYNPQVSLGSSLDYTQQQHQPLPQQQQQQQSRAYYGRYGTSASPIPSHQSYPPDTTHMSAPQANTLQGALGSYTPMNNQQHMPQFHQPGAGSAGPAAPQFYAHNPSTTYSMPSARSFPPTQRQSIDYSSAVAAAAAPRYVGTESPSSDLGTNAHSQSGSPAMTWSGEEMSSSIVPEASQQASYSFAPPMPQPMGISSGSRRTNATAVAVAAGGVSLPAATAAPSTAAVSGRTASSPKAKRKTQQQTRSAGSSTKQGRPTKRPKTSARLDSETDSEYDGSDGGRTAFKEAGEGLGNGNLSRP